MNNRDNIDHHLSQAYSHIEQALDLSIEEYKRIKQSQEALGRQWEEFLGRVYHAIKEKGKANRINLLGWISFSRLRKWL
ncbi:hypothetical protein JQC72_10740 [Polycladomyces sp. WAk]|uniref:Uncharacterized protein n=1 Tax=Polycladomyces zharkentensis TaxID=2807616 RepID=A0ABS2WKD4_9BACL|nr:hypothetical protein [Polycladomyces sp. WAk]